MKITEVFVLTQLFFRKACMTNLSQQIHLVFTVLVQYQSRLRAMVCADSLDSIRPVIAHRIHLVFSER